MSQRWRASHTDSDVLNHYAKRYVKGKFEVNFHMFCPIIKVTNKRKIYGL